MFFIEKKSEENMFDWVGCGVVVWTLKIAFHYLIITKLAWLSSSNLLTAEAATFLVLMEYLKTN